MLQPGQQTKALVHSNLAGTIIVEPAHEVRTKYGVPGSHGVHQVNPDPHFYVYIANFSNRPVTLPRNTVVARFLPGPATLFVLGQRGESPFQILAQDQALGAQQPQAGGKASSSFTSDILYTARGARPRFVGGT